MNKVTLKEALVIYNKKIKNLKNRNAYKSFMIEKFAEDKNYLEDIQNLYQDIDNAERAVGINNLKVILNKLELEAQYYDTSNSNKYPAEHISREDRDYIIDKYSKVKSDIDYVKNLMADASEQVYIELS